MRQDHCAARLLFAPVLIQHPEALILSVEWGLFARSEPRESAPAPPVDFFAEGDDEEKQDDDP